MKQANQCCEMAREISQSTRVEECDDTCFQINVCQAPLRSTERQGQHSHQSAYRAALMQYS